ncbi:phytoene/squalene synthase family protein [Tepidiforma sp.]|uniref:phytoene/squalene synthase family protein n=1 Tax=Tepidiforma sp. TaxID=2682230 RepID=UPI002ADD8095|nr:phytoene/squalene synthase family protein [Tepidiforma sp.]
MEASSWEADLLTLASGGDERYEGGGGARPTATDADFAHCDRVTREHSTTFYTATRLLPAEKRRGVRALYAFCRVADDIVDEPGGDREGRLRAWGAAGTGAAESNGDPVLRAWGATREAFGIEVHLAGQLIEALANDLDHRGYEDWPGLARYCYGVAATVGLMSMRIIGSKGEPALYAIRLGVAMQLTNILRDVAEDWRNGRVYLPREDMERFGVTVDHVASGRVDEAWRALMRFEVARARELYRGARPGLGLLHRDGRFAVSAALELYSRILDDIERRDYDVFAGRAHVAGWRRFGLLPLVAWRAMRPPEERA